MIWEHSAGIIPYCEERKKRKYLLLLSALTKNELWEFPKGGIEKGESAEEAARREFEEETGIQKVEIVDGFKKQLKYFYKRDDTLIGKTVTYFLGKVRSTTVIISDESKAYRCVDYEDAIKLLRHKNLRETLTEAEEYLKHHDK
jgi:bis(5'-nucleosidyl)-tetraphosphatase